MQAMVLLSIADGVASIVLNRPERRNALTAEMADELVAVFREINADARIGAAIISGAGGSFCAGADLGEAARMFADPLDPDVHDRTTRIYDAFVQAGRLEVPTIAAIRGAAVGAGMNLAMAADVRVVARDARLISGFLKLGVHPGGGHMHLLGEAAGLQAACAMALFGDEVDGARAETLGIAWRAVGDDDVDAAAMQMALRAGRDPLLSRAAVKVMRSTASRKAADWATALQAERAQQLWSMKRAGLRGAAPRVPGRD